MISDARKSDLYKISKIMANSIAHPWNDENLIASFLNDYTHFLIYKEGEEILGYLIYKLIADEAEIESIAVAKEHRKKGIATKLVKEICADTVFLEVRASNLTAIAFYKKMGFSQISIRKNYYHKPTEDAIIMQKNE